MTLRLFLCLSLVPLAGLRAADVKTFLETHCYDCHDAETRKGKFQMDELPTDQVTADQAKAWARILARLEAGDMPPPKKARPPAAETAAVLAWCKTTLAAEARARRGEGGALTRRLNRLEYENTVHDLLGIAVPLRALLPEDDRADGFDTAAHALRISPVQIQRYMEAADVALQAAMMRGPRPQAATHRFSYDHEKERAFFAQESFGRQLVRREGELQFFAEPSSEVPAILQQLSELTRRQPGRYRVRVAARTLDAQGQSVVFGVRTASPKQRLGIAPLGWFDAPPEVARVFEMEAHFTPGDTIIVEPYRLNDLRRQRGYSQYAPGDGPVIAQRTALKNPPPASGLALGIAYVEVEGPLVEAWPPVGHQRLFGEVPLVPFNKLPAAAITPGAMQRSRAGTQLTPLSRQPAEDAERLLRAFLPRAFRRPVSDEDVAPYLGIVQQHLERAECFESAMLAAYRAVLCSPDFIFLVGEPGPLDDHTLAARLSYFLWRTAPDDALRALADRGELRQPAVLRRETERLLASPRAQAFVTDFLDQWLHLREIAATQPDKKLFPEFYIQDGPTHFKEDGLLVHSMLEETRLFFADLLRENGSLLQLLDADFTYLNQRLAGFYGLSEAFEREMGRQSDKERSGAAAVSLSPHLPVSLSGSTALRRVTLPPGSPRGGVLTQASVLKVTANGTRTSPIVRGVWVMENILGRKPLPPPPDAGSIDPDTRGSTTIREQLAKHQRSETCASCHRQIDPPGFALESFDPAGQWREVYRTLDGVQRLKTNRPQPKAAPGQTLVGRDLLGPMTWLPGQPVDASGALLDGRTFTGPAQLKARLLEEPRTFARCLAAKLTTYATGHATEPGDLLALEAIVAEAEREGWGLRALLHGVIQSELFRIK
jgi:hypothetical protein